MLRHQALPQIGGNILNGIIGEMLLHHRHLWQLQRRQHLPQFGLPFDFHVRFSFGEIFNAGGCSGPHCRAGLSLVLTHSAATVPFFALK